MAFITCSNLSFAYGHNLVIDNLNFKVENGDYICVIGDNGSGKSTLLKGILGLKAPCSGNIKFGENIKPSEIGYLPQQTAIQKNFPAGVYEIVLSGRLSSRGIFPFYSAKDRQIARENINNLGIENLKNKNYGELSGGQQQRVLLARALCAAKRLLLLDEPVSGLDPSTAQEMYSLIEKINRENKMTIVMVSHDIQNAVKYSHYLLHLKNNETFFGKTEDYIKSDLGNGFFGGRCL